MFAMRSTRLEKIVETVIDVEMEVAIRKYEVDEKRLVKVLREHKGKRTNQEIAEMLDCPETMVAHWFRRDKYFAVPGAEYWGPLKRMLNIETDEFDKAITEYELRGNGYDMRNRIYVGAISPTLTAECKNYLYLLPKK